LTEQDVASIDPGAPPATLADVAQRVAQRVTTLDGELAEIEMLVTQARTEAERHELKRAQTAEKFAALPPGVPSEDAIALSTQVTNLTRRAAVMESQVEVLEGKRKVLTRFRDELAEIAGGLGAGGDGSIQLPGSNGAVAGPGAEPAAAGVSRIVLTAQEELRREIARAMHDGPAQSLTNITLQAQIVERLLLRDPGQARGEVRQLMSMVQQTLDATKSFIFDVRPMVLDDLGLVPTLRRATRERGKRAGIEVDFDSMGTDRRLPMDLESGLFRILDDAMAGYLSVTPDRLVVRLDWTDDRIEGHITATRNRTSAIDDAEQEVASQAANTAAGKDTPPALAAMMADRMEKAEAAVEAARNALVVSLPGPTWREIEQRAATLGISAQLVANGGELQIGIDIPHDEPS
jgi:two-component system sensor histidine kinase DegS